LSGGVVAGVIGLAVGGNKAAGLLSVQENRKEERGKTTAK
jgi:hypothetical protein